MIFEYFHPGICLKGSVSPVVGSLFLKACRHHTSLEVFATSPIPSLRSQDKLKQVSQWVTVVSIPVEARVFALVYSGSGSTMFEHKRF